MPGIMPLQQAAFAIPAALPCRRHFPSLSPSLFPPSASPRVTTKPPRPPSFRRRHAPIARAKTVTEETSEAATGILPPNVKLPVVAIVGRPNVGKSTLVNRLAGAFRNGAIVENVVGITRDRTYRAASWNGQTFQVVDTGGLVFDDQSTFLPEIRAQALVAIREAAAVVLCVDGQAGVNPLDEELASFLRREMGSRDVFVAVNKCESEHGFVMASDFWSLGLGEPCPVSAIHGSGTGDLLDRVVKVLPVVSGDIAEDVVNVAIVGRPNVGKSSLLNVLVGSERAIVSTIPGTTRDAVDEIIVVHGKRYRLIDTAGIRRKTRVGFGTEFFMINRAFKAIRRADVVLLLMDVNEASEQDRKIADRIADEGKGCVVLANKWDLVEKKDDRSYKNAVDDVRERAVCIPWAPVELVSVLEKKRVSKVIGLVDEALEQHRRRISTGVLNEVLRDAVEWHKPPASRSGKQGRIYYCTQVASRPPTIAMFVNEPRLFGDNYRRYMQAQFRKSLGFSGTPMRLVWRGKAKPPALT